MTKLGHMTFVCSASRAKMFRGENSKGSLTGTSTSAKFSLCCSKGAIKLPPLKDPPERLQSLLTGNTKSDCNFRNNIRAYNSSLAFASMCVTGKEHRFTNKGPYCYRINGQVYHVISQMQPEPGKEPGFSQIYIYDQENELNNCLKCFTHLDRNVLQDLQDMMEKVNPYAQKYSHVGNIIKKRPTQDVQLILKATGKNVDPRRYNLPTGTDMAEIIPTDENCTVSGRDVVIHKSVAFHPEGQ